MADTSAFLDQQLVSTTLYGTQQRLADRTGSLMSAKTAGRPAAEVIAAYAARARPGRGVVLDIGCGRGASTLALTQALPQARICAIDASAALLAATRDRLAARSLPAHTVRADFHRLPLASGQAALAVAAFCLYHSPTPRAVLTEIARCLAPGGTVILATKAADSYASLDRLVARAGLDPDAIHRPGLYTAFHSGNLRALTAGAFTVTRVEHEVHRFRFRDLAHTAAYLATSPKYQLPAGLEGNAAALADHLRHQLPDGPVETASVVSYLTATHT
ncbi:class I SAM-dependent methyltransferase [Streptomyces sp. NRRL S-87]|uniref:class I SAM-dependent methyltransferase n=1 Tax=Streptomyces sp. NRRL S-87 TaxID=1463920 RepID=UPI0004C284BB|nr:class I SAM-dependent methyltransferase [Streptomyces sp. NRRL S-87]